MIHLYFFIVGSIIASFLGLVIDRFPKQSIITPRSHCQNCQHSLAPRDLIPILSQVLNHFRCRFCKCPIPLRYAFFEASLGLLFLLTSLAVLHCSELLLLTMGLTLSLYDLKHLEYPLLIWLFFHLPLVVLGENLFLMFFFLILAGMAERFFLGIGAGDFLFLASSATLFHLTDLLFLIQLACIFGLLHFSLKSKKDRIPFIPCLFLATFLMIIFRFLGR